MTTPNKRSALDARTMLRFHIEAPWPGTSAGSCRMSRKSVWPIIAGFLLLAVLSVGADMLLRGFFPKAFGPSAAPLGALASVVTIFYASAFGVLSSYLTAALAPSRPVMHALVLGGIVFLSLSVAWWAHGIEPRRGSMSDS